jgi:CheY-like chemotaxis protein
VAYPRSANERIVDLVRRSRLDLALRLYLCLVTISPAVLTGALTRFAFVGAFVNVSLQGLTVLVVDDDSDIRKSMARILRLAGAQVSVTSSVEDALQRLEGDKWDVVVSDIGMPCLSGYDLIRQARERGDRVPMIAVTAFDTPEHRRQISCTGSRAISSSYLIPSTSWR